MIRSSTKKARKIALVFSFSMLVMLDTTIISAAPIEMSGELEALFIQRAEAAVMTIPEPIWQSLDASGWRIQLTDLVIEAVPQLAGKQPRGWPTTTRWENSDAVFLTRSKLIVIAQHRHNSEGETVAARRVEGVLRHEVGHAFDLHFQNRRERGSSSQAFLTAYRTDRNAMKPAIRTTLSYYLQTGPSGRQETYAEAFAILHGGGSDEANAEDFRKLFARTMEVVRTNCDTNDR